MHAELPIPREAVLVPPRAPAEPVATARRYAKAIPLGLGLALLLVIGAAWLTLRLDPAWVTATFAH